MSSPPKKSPRTPRSRASRPEVKPLGEHLASLLNPSLNETKGFGEAPQTSFDAGAVSINDGGLTTEAWDAEKNSFKFSGMGPSRMGPTGLLRFLRKRAILIRRGPVKTMADLDERGVAPGP